MITVATTVSPLLPLEPAAVVSSAETGRVVDIVAGPLEVRLAETVADVEAAQALRYRIFYERMGAHPAPEMARRRRDFDAFDDICDHLLVLDNGRGEGPEAVVGTYRLIRREAALRHGSFYSAAEEALVARFHGDHIPSVGEVPDPDGVSTPPAAVPKEVGARVTVISERRHARDLGHDLLVGLMLNVRRKAV